MHWNRILESSFCPFAVHGKWTTKFISSHTLLCVCVIFTPSRYWVVFDSDRGLRARRLVHFCWHLYIAIRMKGLDRIVEYPNLISNMHNGRCWLVCFFSVSRFRTFFIYGAVLVLGKTEVFRRNPCICWQRHFFCFTLVLFGLLLISLSVPIHLFLSFPRLHLPPKDQR